MRRPSKNRLAEGDVVRLVWFDIEGKNGWLDAASRDKWCEEEFKDCVTYGRVEKMTVYGIVVSMTRAPSNPDAAVMDISKIPWGNVRSFEVLRANEDVEDGEETPLDGIRLR